MNIFKALSFAALSLLAPGAMAQVVSVGVGPNPAPVGSTVFASVTNNLGGSIVSFGQCSWRVRDAAGAVVFEPLCVGSLLVSPLGTIDYAWDQRDMSGQLVPPGDYTFDVATSFGSFSIDFVVGGIESNIFLQGTAAIGTAPFGFNGGRDIAVSSPSNPGAIYGVFLSGTLGTGIDLCGQTFPILLDSLALASLNNGIINNAFGVLDSDGETVQAALPIPDEPSLVGLDLHLAAAIFDTSLACPIIDITPAVSATVVAGI